MQDQPSDSETAAETGTSDAPGSDDATFAWEAARLEEAFASARAGHVVDFAKVKTWIASIGTDHELPVPYSDR